MTATPEVEAQRTSNGRDSVSLYCLVLFRTARHENPRAGLCYLKQGPRRALIQGLHSPPMRRQHGCNRKSAEGQQVARFSRTLGEACLLMAARQRRDSRSG
jgi:hypothetical protein